MMNHPKCLGCGDKLTSEDDCIYRWMKDTDRNIFYCHRNCYFRLESECLAGPTTDGAMITEPSEQEWLDQNFKDELKDHLFLRAELDRKIYYGRNSTKQ